MQNAQEINWWAISLPSIITGLFVIATQIILAFWLSKKTERFKSELGKELESYKYQLQSTFQTQFYQFQTKFSVLHQEQAKVTKELFAKLVKLKQIFGTIDGYKKAIETNNPLGELLSDESKKEMPKKLVQNAIENINEVSEYYEQNRIFISTEVCQKVDKFIVISSELFTNHFIEFVYKYDPKNPLTDNQFTEVLSRLSAINVSDLINALQQLELEFRNFIAVDSPSQKQDLLTK